MLNYYQSLLQSLHASPTNSTLKQWATMLPSAIEHGLSEKRYGDLTQWKQALTELPHILSHKNNLKDTVMIGDDSDISKCDQAIIEKQLRALIPWRKGPISLHGITIDTEWRSDWKWERLLPHITSLKNRQVLDVGCGNGYHCLRCFGEGAERVIGIDPSPRFIVQFYMMKHFLGDVPVDVLPLGIESLPHNLQAFDTTFSMGVLYHRKSPIDHLRELKATLKPGGQLVLETLLIEGGLGDTLVPEGRYAMMNNVWFLPSADTLISWMKKCGFKNPRLVDLNRTNIQEQRQTDWMTFHSLNEFLNPQDPNQTIEGHPAPLRGVFIAEV